MVMSLNPLETQFLLLFMIVCMLQGYFIIIMCMRNLLYLCVSTDLSMIKVLVIHDHKISLHQILCNCSLKAAITKHENTVHVYIHNPSTQQYCIPKYRVCQKNLMIFKLK